MNAAGVYPANVSPRPDSWSERDREPLVEVLSRVRALFLAAAREGEAVLFWYE